MGKLRENLYTVSTALWVRLLVAGLGLIGAVYSHAEIDATDQSVTSHLQWDSPSHGVVETLNEFYPLPGTDLLNPSDDLIEQVKEISDRLPDGPVFLILPKSYVEAHQEKINQSQARFAEAGLDLKIEPLDLETQQALFAFAQKQANSTLPKDEIWSDQEVAQELALDNESPKDSNGQKKFPLWVRPTPGETILGLTMTSAGTALNAAIWLGMGVNPWLVAGIVTAYTITDLFHSVFYLTADRLYSGDRSDPSTIASRKEQAKKFSKWKEFALRVGMVGFVAELIGLLKSMSPEALAHDPSALSLTGQIGIGVYLLARASGIGITGVVRSRKYGNSRRVSRWLLFYQTLLITPWVIFDFAGLKGPVWLTLGSAKITTTTIGILSSYLLMAGLGIKFSNFFRNAMLWHDRKSHELGQAIKSWSISTKNKVQGLCNRVFQWVRRKPQEESP